MIERWISNSYKRIVNKYKPLKDLGAYKLLSSLDIVNDATLRFMRNVDSVVYNDEEHVFKSLNAYVFHEIMKKRDGRTKNYKWNKLGVSGLCEDNLLNYSTNPAHYFDINNFARNNCPYLSLTIEGYSQEEISKMYYVAQTSVSYQLKKERKLLAEYSDVKVN